MKIKSVSGVTCYVKDLGKTADFYETLGFEIKKRDENHITVYSNWFWIEFIAMEQEDRPGYIQEAHAIERGAGILLYLSVENVNESYQELLATGVKSAGEPHNSPYGNREFIIYDPDGYRLAIFKRK